MFRPIAMIVQNRRKPFGRIRVPSLSSDLSEHPQTNCSQNYGLWRRGPYFWRLAQSTGRLRLQPIKEVCWKRPVSRAFGPPVSIERLLGHSLGLSGAVKKTRTSTAFRPQRPQRCASTNSAMTARPDRQERALSTGYPPAQQPFGWRYPAHSCRNTGQFRSKAKRSGKRLLHTGWLTFFNPCGQLSIKR